MNQAVINIASFRTAKRVFTFCENCPECGRAVEPFVVAGMSTGRYMCEGLPDVDDADTGYHKPVHWRERQNAKSLA